MNMGEWKKLGTMAALAVVGIAWAGSARSEEKKAKDAERPRIQVAILLDTSNSMDGLINQARTQLWKIVNEFTSIQLGGEQPKLEVALYEYGNDGLPAQEGFIRMVVPLTTDLDKVSEALFALKTNGGEEFCGRVIDQATRSLQWSTSPKDVKCIFIAGNEPFTQGDFDYTKACKAAAARGITVSTIFCGSRQEGIATKWEDGAKLADGTYMNIDQNQAAAEIAAPQDKELAGLSTQLNQTYLFYGEATKRREAAQRQIAQDANAGKAAASAAAARANVKASAHYSNANWDLVDAVKEGKVKLDELKPDQLPPDLRDKKPAERQAVVDAKLKERKAIQAKIQQLSVARQKFVDQKQQQLAADAAKSGAPAAAAPAFERAVIDAVKAEAAKK